MLYEDGKKYIGRFDEDRLVDKYNELNEDMAIKLYEDYLINNQNIKENKDIKDNKDNNIISEIKKKPKKIKKNK